MTSQPLFSLPLAFILYLLGAGLFSAAGRRPTGARRTAVYASGEEAPAGAGVPGYRPYFLAALFFGMLHLGALIIATALPSSWAAVYVGGLIVILLCLIVG